MASFNSSVNSQVSQQNKLEYRRVLEELPTDDSTMQNEERMERIEQALKRARDLTKEATANASERHLDSFLMQQLSHATLTSAESVEVNTNVYDWKELASHILTKPEQWEFRLPLQIASFGLTHGAFEPTPPEERPRKPRQRVERQKHAVTKRPEAVDKLVKVDEDAVMISKVRKFIKRACGAGPLSYFHLVLDPRSFSRTVENMYYLSFLANDGTLSVYVCPQHGIPMVKVVSKAQAENNVDSRRKQFVVSIDMDYWQKLCVAFKVKEAQMKL